MEYIIKNIDLTITHVFDYAKTNLRTGDIIKKINEASVKTYEELSEELAKYTSGEKLNIIVSRNNKTTACYAQLSTKENNVVIGISLLEVKEVETTPTVKYIFKNNESGSSRGLLCALDIYDKLTIDDLTKGDIIAGTGSINEKGEVGAVDGIKYKLAGAVKKKADVFIVPTENYEEAINIKNKNKYTIEIIEADNLHNVIEKLKQRN
ncbi:MAG: PDZ domain-containing protein [Tenericutes bacterium]|nr:PDZ domain-containing protein [Mycoplasmatota bacterium]